MRVHDDLNTIPRKNTIDGLILAGGQSRRLGGIDKGLLEVSGQPLIQHVANNLCHQTSGISIIANRSLSTYQNYAQRVFPDTIEGFAGPLAGLASFAGRAHSSWVALVACDLIFLPNDWVTRLLSVAISQHKTVVCASDKVSGRHALCALARRECLPSAQTLLNNGLHRWMDWLQHNQAAYEPFDSEELFNINSWDDTLYAKKLWGNRCLR